MEFFMFLSISIHELIHFSFNLFKKCWCVVSSSLLIPAGDGPTDCKLFSAFFLDCISSSLFAKLWICFLGFQFSNRLNSEIHCESHSFAALSKSSSFRTICSHECQTRRIEPVHSFHQGQWAIDVGDGCWRNRQHYLYVADI